MTDDASVPKHIARAMAEWYKEPRTCPCLDEAVEAGAEVHAWIYVGLMSCWDCFCALFQVLSASRVPFECGMCGGMTVPTDEDWVDIVRPKAHGNLQVVVRSCPSCEPGAEAA